MENSAKWWTIGGIILATGALVYGGKKAREAYMRKAFIEKMREAAATAMREATPEVAQEVA